MSDEKQADGRKLRYVYMSSHDYMPWWVDKQEDIYSMHGEARDDGVVTVMLELYEGQVSDKFAHKILRGMIEKQLAEQAAEEAKSDD